MTDEHADTDAFHPTETAPASGYATFVIDRALERTAVCAQRDAVGEAEPAAAPRTRRRTERPRRPAVAAAALDGGGRELCLAADPSQLSRARTFADAAAKDFGFADEERFSLTLAVSEAVANAIEHGGGELGARVRITAGERDGAFAVQIEDSGSFEAGARQDEDLPERGRGLGLIAMLVDELFVCPGPDGTVLRLFKRPAG